MKRRSGQHKICITTIAWKKNGHTIFHFVVTILNFERHLLFLTLHDVEKGVDEGVTV